MTGNQTDQVTAAVPFFFLFSLRHSQNAGHHRERSSIHHYSNYQMAHINKLSQMYRGNQPKSVAEKREWEPTERVNPPWSLAVNRDCAEKREKKKKVPAIAPDRNERRQEQVDRTRGRGNQSNRERRLPAVNVGRALLRVQCVQSRPPMTKPRHRHHRN